jgi:protein-disulfide isomerase
MTPRRRLAVVATLALVVVAGAVIASPDPSPAPAPAAASSATPFDGIEQDGIALGSPKAPLVLTEFADLQCPFCAMFARDVLPGIVERHVRTGRLRLELHVLTFLGEDSVRAGGMAAAAARQDRLWSFADAFYRSQGPENSGYVTDDFLRRTGETAGLDVGSAFAARGRPEVLATLTEAQRAAAALEVDHTPALYLRRGDGPARPVEPSELAAVLEAR